jgi:hypothetical protein
LPQALVLTAIVIAFGMTAFVIMLALKAKEELGNDHVDGRDAADGQPERASMWAIGRRAGDGRLNQVVMFPLLLPLFAAVVLLLSRLWLSLTVRRG